MLSNMAGGETAALNTWCELHDRRPQDPTPSNALEQTLPGFSTQPACCGHMLQTWQPQCALSRGRPLREWYGLTTAARLSHRETARSLCACCNRPKRCKKAHSRVLRMVSILWICLHICLMSLMLLLLLNMIMFLLLLLPRVGHCGLPRNNWRCHERTRRHSVQNSAHFRHGRDQATSLRSTRCVFSHLRYAAPPAGLGTPVH